MTAILISEWHHDPLRSREVTVCNKRQISSHFIVWCKQIVRGKLIAPEQCQSTTDRRCIAGLMDPACEQLA